MKVKDLIETLNKVEDKSIPVWVSSDPEGNSFGKAAVAQLEIINNGEVICEEDVPDDELYIRSYAVVIWP